MHRVASFLALAALALSLAVASATYSEAQSDVIDARVGLCVKDVPRLGRLDLPGLACRNRAYQALVLGAVNKEGVTTVVVDCLKSHPLASDLVADVERCLVEAMAQRV